MTQFALVGCGLAAQRHKTEILRTGNLAAVCDIDPGKARALAEGTSARVYTSLDSLLESEPAVDMVVVCSPNGLHAEHAIKSLQARRHVLCETPLCIAFTAAWSMRDTAHFFRRRLFLTEQSIFGTAAVFAKQQIAAGALGQIRSFSVQGFRHQPPNYPTGGPQGSLHHDGGILYTEFSSIFSLLVELLGAIHILQACVSNSGTRSNFELEDSVAALLQTDAGAIGTASFSINASADNQESSITIIGDKGSIQLGGKGHDALAWNLTDGGKDKPDGQFEGLQYPSGYASPATRVYDQVQQALAGKPYQLMEAKDAVRTVTVIEQLYAAARS